MKTNKPSSKFKLERTDLRDRGNVLQNNDLKEQNENEGEKVENSVRREVPYTDTLYVNGSVQGVKTSFVLDTGAEKTVISDRIFNQIEDCLKPNVTKRGK